MTLTSTLGIAGSPTPTSSSIPSGTAVKTPRPAFGMVDVARYGLHVLLLEDDASASSVDDREEHDIR